MNLILFAPLYLFLAYYHKITKSTLFWGFLAGAIYFFAVDPFAVVWKAWQFDSKKTLTPFFGPTLVEELVWSVLVFGFTALLVKILSEAEEKGIKFKNLLKK